MEWMAAAGRIVEAVGTRDFPCALARGLREIAHYDYTVIFGKPGGASE